MKPTTSVIIALCLWAGAGSAGSAAAGEYYIAPAPRGNDATGDGSLAKPWATPWGAQDHLGDRTPYTLNFLGGLYLLQGAGSRSPGGHRMDTIEPPSGDSTAWTVYRAYPESATVVIRPSPARSWPRGGGAHAIFDLRDKQRVLIQGFDIGNDFESNDPVFSAESLSVGIYCDRCDSVRFVGNRINDTWTSAIHVTRTSHALIGGNRIRRAMLGGRNARGLAEETVTISECTGCRVESNTISGIPFVRGAGFIGICVKANSTGTRVAHNTLTDVTGSAIYVLGSLDTQVSGNLIQGSHGDGIVVSNECVQANPEPCATGRYTRDTRIVNNIVHDNDKAGIVVRAVPGGDKTGEIEGVAIVNNTVCYNRATGIENTTVNAADVLIRNNISCYNLGSVSCGADSTLKGIQIHDTSRKATMDHNLLAGNLYHNVPLGETDKIGDPRFCAHDTATGEFDFHVAATSAAVDSGLASAGTPGLDFDGRPRGNPCDIGAYEGGYCRSGVPGGRTSAVYRITIDKPRLKDGTLLDGPVDIVVTGSLGTVVFRQKTLPFGMVQPACFIGEVRILVPDHAFAPREINGLGEARILTFVSG